MSTNTLCPRCQKNLLTDKNLCAVCVEEESEVEAATLNGDGKGPTPSAKRRSASPKASPADGSSTTAAATQPAPKAAPMPTVPVAQAAPPPLAAAQALDRARPVASPKPTPIGMPRISTGMRPTAYNFVFYGPGGVGKTSLVTSIPGLVLIPLEETPGLTVPRFDDPAPPANLAEVIRIIRWLKAEPHDYKALGIDTADKLEQYIMADCVRRSNERNEQDVAAETIEHVGKGYKKGYVAAAQKWQEVLAELDQLRQRRGMHIVFTAHDVVSRKQNPLGEDFDQSTIALHHEAGRPLLIHWADAVVHCNYVSQTKRSGKRGPTKGIGGHARALYTTNADAYIAKNRFDLPSRMAFDSAESGWLALEHAIEQWSSPGLLRQAIEDALAKVGHVVVDVKGTTYTIEQLTRHRLAQNPSRQVLAQYKHKLEARVLEVEEAAEADDAERELAGAATPADNGAE